VRAVGSRPPGCSTALRIPGSCPCERRPDRRPNCYVRLHRLSTIAQFHTPRNVLARTTMPSQCGCCSARSTSGGGAGRKAPVCLAPQAYRCCCSEPGSTGADATVAPRRRIAYYCAAVHDWYRAAGGCVTKRSAYIYCDGRLLSVHHGS
jgi:hypothetical protein